MKPIFNYSPYDGRYIPAPDDAPDHIKYAMESPREEGVYIIPANATDVEPPVEVDKWPVFNGDAWVLVDYIISKPIYSIESGERIEPEFGKSIEEMHATGITPPVAGDKQVAVFENHDWVLKPDWRGLKLYSTADGSEVVINEVGVVPSDIDATEDPIPGVKYSWGVSQWVVDVEKVALQFDREKAEAISYVGYFIQAERQKVAGTSDPIEAASWSDKLRIATKIQSGTASDGEIAIFSAEIEARKIEDETLEIFCQKVISNAAIYLMAFAVLDGIKRASQDAINAAATKAEIDSAIEQMKSEITTKIGV